MSSYQRRRGELQSLGEVVQAALASARRDPKFYTPPWRPIEIKRVYRRNRRGDNSVKSGVVDSGQLSFKFPEAVRDPEHPLIDLIPEAYR